MKLAVTEKAADDSLAKLTAILAPAMLQMLSSDVFPVCSSSYAYLADVL